MTFLSPRGLWLLVGCLCPSLSLAQLSVSSPVPRMVFQRGNANTAAVLVTGLAPPTATTVEARFIPLAPDQGQPTGWTPLTFLSDTRAFRGNITVSAGWYRLDVRAKSGSTVLNLTSVNRVGVGEVFIIAGQSNAVGGFERPPSAADDRVSCLDFRQDELDEQLLPLRFSHVSYGSSIGPGQPPHIWGMLGDALVQRLNVPVLFLGAATAGTSSDQWRQSAAGNNVLQGKPYPYRQLGVVLQHYIARTGMRAVLWHQGEGDIGSSNDTYFNNLKYVIQKSRQQSEFGGLPWVVSRVTYTQGQTNSNVIAAQNRLISEVPNVYAGPTTDDLIGSDNRLDDNVHIGRNGLRRFADRWSASLSDAFFAQSTPFTPASNASLITGGYTLPLARRPGETLLVSSLRSNAQETDNQYFVQLLRASDNAIIAESPRTTANPIPFTLPASLPDGQYRLRTGSTRPVVIGALGELFTVNYFAQSTSPPTPILPDVTGGIPDVALLRMGYRYEPGVPAFYFMAEAIGDVQCKLERLDGGFGDSGWYTIPPASQGPDYGEFADYNYLRYYPPVSFGVGGVPPGRYRLSMRKQGDTGAGVWVETTLRNGRGTIYIAPDVVTVESDEGKADLSLSAQLSSRTPAVGQPVTVTLDVANDGPQPASGVVVSGSLPPNLAFVDALSAGINAQGSAVTINAGTLESGAVQSFSFRVTPTVPGRYLPALQITASSAADPDSQPDSGTEDGQDDATQLDFRTPDSGIAVFISPNPRQTPLPPVQSSQPPTNPAKADLSLNIAASTLTPTPNQPFTLTLTVSNQGGSAASNVSVATQLPTGWQLVNSASANVSINGQDITGLLPSISAGSSTTLLLTVRGSGTGTLKAQIQAATPADPDSTPGNGYDNGEDDAATMQVRTP